MVGKRREGRFWSMAFRRNEFVRVFLSSLFSHTSLKEKKKLTFFFFFFFLSRARSVRQKWKRISCLARCVPCVSLFKNATEVSPEKRESA